MFVYRVRAIFAELQCLSTKQGLFLRVLLHKVCIAGRATLKTKMCNIKLATQTIAYIIWCKTVADALKINV